VVGQASPKFFVLMRLSLLFVLVVVGIAFADIAADKVTSIPHYNEPIPFNQYAGYIDVDKTHGRSLFYWFVESQNNPSTDPVVLWLNGGPGCSSLDGFLYEHGPFRFDRSGTGNIYAHNDTLRSNPFAWNQVANMIYLEAPAGVGFSYSNTSSDYYTNDNKTAIDNYQFLLNFFASYPEFAANDFYIAGESYAGIYVPTLAYYVHQQNSETSNPKINLKGILVGNGVTDEEYDAHSFIQFAYNHALYSPLLYKKLSTHGCLNGPKSVICGKLLIEMHAEIGNVNIYDIYKGCYPPAGSSSAYSPLDFKFAGQENVGLSPPCINSAAASEYLNLPEVRQAIHAMPASAIGPWEICSNKVIYNKLYPSVVGAYEVLTQHYRVLVYSGDSDGAVPYLGTIEWIEAFEGNKTPIKDWVAWSTLAHGKAGYDPTAQVAGYVTVYDNLNFVSVKGAGHMVPQYKPAEGYAMFASFLAGKFP